MIGTARQKSKILAPLRYIISVNALKFSPAAPTEISGQKWSSFHF